nr:hypothetical protein Iba_chr14bCG7850 [Ipomoea batatas]
MVHTITVQTADRRRSFSAATLIRYRPIQHQRQLVTPVTVRDINSPIVGEIPIHNEKKIAPSPHPRPIQGGKVVVFAGEEGAAEERSVEVFSGGLVEQKRQVNGFDGDVFCGDVVYV